MAKVGAGTLEDLLKNMKTPNDPNLIVGYDKADDASVYKISDNIAIINTVDFFPPVCDDAYMYGQIAAANALSDIYAMGGQPKLALNIMSVTKDMDRETISEILHGAYDKAAEAGCIISGGHTIHGEEPVFGLAVTGFIHPNNILANSFAKPGCKLILTKPLGTGIMMTAAKANDGELINTDAMKPVYRNMARLNKYAAEIMLRFPVESCTDITGFGLAGHAMEMANASGYTVHLDSKSIPIYNEAIELASMGILPSGCYSNRDYVANQIEYRNIPLNIQDIILDPQTSGGLLIATTHAEEMLGAMKNEGIEAFIIGEITDRQRSAVIID